MNILIVEDEPIVADFLEAVLTHNDYVVVGKADSAESTETILEKKDVDLILMDINIKGEIDGIQLSKKINLKKLYPTLFLTAYSQEEIVSEAMDSFVVGYIVKPADEQSILTSLKVAENFMKLLGNREDKNSQIYLGEEIYFDEKSEVVRYQNRVVQLTNKENHCFLILAKNRDSVVSYHAIKNCVWQKEDVTSSAMRFTIMNIRKKLPTLSIKNVHGEGYRLETKEV